MKLVLRILCYLVAGFFTYLVALLAFISSPQVSGGAKLAMLLGFSLPAIGGLAVGLIATDASRRWRDTGIVLLSSGGFTLLIVGTLAFYLQQEEFRKLMPPETIGMFSAYGTGFGFLSAILLLGGMGLWRGLRRSGTAAVTS